VLKRKITISLLVAIFFLPILIASAGNKITFCVVGDSRGTVEKAPINTKIIKKIVTAIKKEKPEFILFPGDLVTGYSKKLERQLILWRKTFMKPLLDAGIRVYACRGNHDKSFSYVKKKRKKKKDPLKVWQKVFSGRYAFPQNGPKNARDVTYSVRKGNALILVLDNYTGHNRNEVDVDWVKKTIKTESAKGPKPLHIFAMCHEPAFTVLHKDCLELREDKRDEFVNAFLEAGGKAFFCGHDHLYDHSKIKYPKGEFHQFVCGGAGAPLVSFNGKYKNRNVVNVKTEKAYGYAVVEIDGDKAVITVKAWKDDGNGPLKIIDTFSYTLKK